MLNKIWRLLRLLGLVAGIVLIIGNVVLWGVSILNLIFGIFLGPKPFLFTQTVYLWIVAILTGCMLLEGMLGRVLAFSFKKFAIYAGIAAFAYLVVEGTGPEGGLVYRLIAIGAVLSEFFVVAYTFFKLPARAREDTTESDMPAE